MKHLNLSNPKCRATVTTSLFAAFILMLATVNQSFSQTASGQTGHLVSGIVKDEKGEAMIGASIYLKGSTEGTTTNADGRFEFPRKLNEGDRLTISFIGYESVEYVVKGDADENIEVVMKVDVIVWGEVAMDNAYTTKPGLRQFFRRIF